MRDFIYLSIIIVISGSSIFIWKWDGETQLATQISLITSWVSIFLALLAIFYAIIQTYIGRDETKEVTNNITVLANEVENLRDLKSVVEKINRSTNTIKQNTNKLINDIKSSFEYSLEESADDIKSILDDYKVKEAQQVVERITELLQKNSSQEFVDDFLEETLDESETNGYQLISRYVRSQNTNNEITPKKIRKVIEDIHGVNLTNGQIAGAVNRLKNEGIIIRVSRGLYKKQ